MRQSKLIQFTGLTFDDVQILPSMSRIESRSNVDTSAQLTKNYRIKLPIIAAPMDTVCDDIMSLKLAELGAIGALHRFTDIKTQSRMSEAVLHDNELCIASIGANGDALERAEALLEVGVPILLIDVAHGHHINVERTIGELINKFRGKYQFDIIAGNIATDSAAYDLERWGADAIRVGIGGGSVCETRVRTGIGVPQITAVSTVAAATSLPIISDGGIRYPGDIAKAIAVGADTVMVGSMLAGTNEAPGEVFVAGQWPNNKKFKMYRGSASATIKMEKTGLTQHVEGASKMVESKGSVENIIHDLMDGVKSAMSYVGAHNLDTFYEAAQLIQITNAGLREAHPHLL